MFIQLARHRGRPVNPRVRTSRGVYTTVSFKCGRRVRKSSTSQVLSLICSRGDVSESQRCRLFFPPVFPPRSSLSKARRDSRSKHTTATLRRLLFGTFVHVRVRFLVLLVAVLPIVHLRRLQVRVVTQSVCSGDSSSAQTSYVLCL